MIEFRDYQIRAIQTARSKIGAGVRRIVLNAPTGAGKTCIAAGIVQSAVAKGKRVLFLAHRRELIEQTVNKLVDAGVLHFGVIMSGNRLTSTDAPVQVASIQTLIRRELPPADLIIIDEAHRASARSYLSVIANYPRAAVLGLTATPERTDGKGLDDIFEDMIVVETVPNLIEQGYLVKPVCYVGPTADLSGVRTKRGDYDERQLATVMDKPKLVGDIIENWKRLARGKPTAVFAVNVAHADHIAAEFRAAGVSAAMVSGETPRAEREAIIADWKRGYITVVVNVYVFVEGFDFPEMECVVLARPTQSVSLFLQAVGRVMRPAPNKTSALILDHAGCCQLHGPPHVEREWTLEGMAKKRKQAKEAEALLVCDVCHMMYEPAPKLWLAETQQGLVDMHRQARETPHISNTDGKLRAVHPSYRTQKRLETAKRLLSGRSQDRAMNTCPGCGTTTCLVCQSNFVPKRARRDIDGIAWETLASCPSCHAHYVDDVPHLITDPTETVLPDHTDDQLIRMGDDQIPVKLAVMNDYKRLINEARKTGRKRGWAWYRLRDKYDEPTLKECLPRHTATWWRAQA